MARSFRQRLGSPAKRDNSARKTKTAIRTRVLEAIGAEKARVFDAFAGAGVAYYTVWKRAAAYVGCDLKWYPDERQAYVADNRRILRMLDLGGFNIVDLDAFGSPWEQAYILSARRQLAPGETFGLVLTDGSGLKLKFGASPTALAMLAKSPLVAPDLARQHSRIIDSAIEAVAQRMNGRVVKRHQATGKAGTAMRYIGLVLEGTKKAPTARAGAERNQSTSSA